MKNHNKPITKDDLGNMLHKYINPVYERLDKLETGQNQLKKGQSGFRSELEEIKRIQLRMENRLIDDNKLLHDRDDAHDKKLKGHEKRITSLEENL